ncbi:alpha-ketoglutarate-dependent dioxygenase AlkB family protein [Streptomyces sp. DT24]|uniref:alpha-ketoglutarate-dependent dioxygenase AlkB family protein n=1 Tax=unclassified Streptomyces TaxID=2593676 RepID=UPI0023B8889F|nr:alpha-ketoglutarate-dependent dioxygenase AlkB [Streptomyces sp. AM 4-1-1]WEH35353.1 alpha-ketoglutarate-dependent dioxygenase AlkB [Streptomyces sp. AM 4-1-1]
MPQDDAPSRPSWRPQDGLFPLPERPRTVVAPGAVHVPGWLSEECQRELVEACRDWARGPVPLRHTALPGGGVMSVRTVCLGWHWQPYRYSRTADDVNGARVAAFPDRLGALGRAAVAEAYEGTGIATGPYEPDTALVNFYDGAARMGMHQDKEERSNAPVVSLSLGDTCVFRFGNTENRGRPYTDVELVSGDLFVFGGPSRYAFHGVPKVLAGTAGPASGPMAGRLNLTLRETGAAGSGRWGMSGR